MKSYSWMLLLLIGSLACEVTSEKIQRWKGTQKGPAKLRAAVRDTELKQKLRLEAAVALAEINLVQPLTEDFKSLDPKDRNGLGDPLADKLLAKMKGANATATTRAQMQAKDALFGLRASLGAAAQAKIDTQLVSWIASDWAARAGGEHSAEKIVRTVGKPAGKVLAEKIGSQPKVVVPMAELIGKVGAQADRDAAADRLIALAKKADAPGEQIYTALSKVGSPHAREFLVEQGQKGPTQQRIWALLALKAYPDRALVPKLAAIAADSKEEKRIRAGAFEALEKIDSKATARALAEILAKDSEEIVRYRAAEALVGCCKANGVAKLLNGLSPRYTYKKTDVVDYIEKDIKGLGGKVLPPLRAALGSKSWIARAVAVRVLGDIGKKKDLPAIEKLFNDRTKLKGWEGATVGSEAKAAAARLRKRI